MSGPTVNEAKEAILARFKAGWEAAWPNTPYVFDNENYDGDNNSFVRVAIRHTESDQESIGGEGNRNFKRNGIIFFQLFTAQDKGSKEADNYVTTLQGIFEGVSFSGITCYKVNNREAGQDGKWDKTIVEVKFDYSELK